MSEIISFPQQESERIEKKKNHKMAFNLSLLFSQLFSNNSEQFMLKTKKNKKKRRRERKKKKSTIK